MSDSITSKQYPARPPHTR